MKQNNLIKKLRYKIVEQRPNNVISVQELHTKACYLLPAKKLIHFKNILNCFTKQDREMIACLAKNEKS